MGDVCATIVLTGEVQKVGYRDFVQRAARKLGVVGYVENLRDGSVRVVCEADESVMEEFKKAIDVKHKFIDVENLKIVEITEPTGEFEYFDIKRGDMAEELGERLDVSILYLDAMKEELKGEMKTGLSGLKGEMKTGFSELKEETKKTHEKLDSIESATLKTHEKLDHIAAVTSKSHDTLGSIDHRLDDALNRYDMFGKEITVIREDIGDLKKFANEFSEFKDLFALYVKHELSKDQA